MKIPFFLIRAALGYAAIVLPVLLPMVAHGQNYTVLQNFTGTNGAAPGANPLGSLTLSGSTLYGMTSAGGATDQGTIFSIDVNGGFQPIYSFTGGTGGYQPHHGNIAVSGSTLYGMTIYGGTSGTYGNVFSIGTNGSGYQNLVSFAGDANGSQPHGDVIVSGTSIYGMTSGMTSNTTNVSNGNLYSVGIDGSGFKNLVSFTGTSGVAPGEQPHTGLMLNGSTLYGMTYLGGTSGKGTVFSVGTDGTGYQNLVSFDGSNGKLPAGDLLLIGSTLYGMTSMGGTHDMGTIFSIKTDGTGFQNLLSFSGTDGPAPGALPWGVLTLQGTTLYGMTALGGAYGDGTIFSIGLDGTGFQNLVSFSGTDGPTPGSQPFGSLTLSGSTLYGMTEYGGTNNDGVVFSFAAIPEPSTFAFVGVGLLGLSGLTWLRKRTRF